MWIPTTSYTGTTIPAYLRREGDVSLETRSTPFVAERKLEILPSDTQVLRLVSNREYPTSTMESVQAPIGLSRDVDANTGIDPDRPKVAEYGRRLRPASVASSLRMAYSYRRRV